MPSRVLSAEDTKVDRRKMVPTPVCYVILIIIDKKELSQLQDMGISNLREKCRMWWKHLGGHLALSWEARGDCHEDRS